MPPLAVSFYPFSIIAFVDCLWKSNQVVWIDTRRIMAHVMDFMPIWDIADMQSVRSSMYGFGPAVHSHTAIALFVTPSLPFPTAALTLVNAAFQALQGCSVFARFHTCVYRNKSAR